MSRTNEHRPNVSLTIDGRRLEAPSGTYVLHAARRLGIEIPTLCNHPDLEPVGACRVCMVEVTHRDWGGWSGLMTACLYPVAEGIEVSTQSPRVREARRGVLALLAARCPESRAIQELARQYDADPARLGFAVDPAADNCILCGLCTRVCSSYATSAIATVGRGAIKSVGSFARTAPEECVGCGACAAVCPTDNIAARRNPGSYTIWGRTFPTATATVDAERCLGCGSCEEACPFKVAQVLLHVTGSRTVRIPSAHCRGCGVCVSVCPSGALHQQSANWGDLVAALSGNSAQGGQP